MEISCSRHSFYNVTFSKRSNQTVKVRKTAQKALGRALKSGAEGESLKLLKKICAIFSLRTWYHLRLPCHCDEGERDGDDGLLVHVSFWTIGTHHRLICYRCISLRVSFQFPLRAGLGRWWCRRGRKGWFQEFRWCRIGQRQSSGNW